MTEDEELELLELEKEKVSAAPARVFTGKEERAAEDKALLDSLGIDSKIPGVKPVTNQLAKLGFGLGKGMYGAHLTISDLMGRLPGLSRVDPQWRQDEEELSRPLSQTAAGGAGDLLGQAAMLAPAGVAGGAAATVALPSALAAAAPTVASGVDAMLVNGLMSAPSEEGQGALTGLKWGSGIPVGIRAAGALLPRPLRAAGTAIASLLMPGTSVAAREAALKSGAVRAGRTAEDVAARLVSARDASGRYLSGLLSEMEAVGAGGMQTAPVIDALTSRAVDVAPKTMNPAVPNAYVRVADRIADNASDAGTLGLVQAEALKRSLQEGIPYGRPGAKETIRARKEIASMFREAQEAAVADAGAQSPELASLAAEYVPAKTRAGHFIEGAKAAAKAAKPGLYGRLGDIAALSTAAGAGFAHGGPMGALWAVPAWALEHVVRTRGPSTAAAATYGLGNLLERAATANPRAFTSALGAAPRAVSQEQPQRLRERLALALALSGDVHAP